MKFYKIFINAREYYTYPFEQNSNFDDIPTVEVESALTNSVASFKKFFLEELEIKDPSYVVKISRISYFGPYMEAHEKLVNEEFVFAAMYRE